MNYELAKELKDAGFPQELRDGYWYSPHTKVVRKGFPIIAEYCYAPTLEELIKACKSIWIEGYNIVDLLWLASRGKGKDVPLWREIKREEALVHLWLVLNKKP